MRNGRGLRFKRLKRFKPVRPPAMAAGSMRFRANAERRQLPTTHDDASAMAISTAIRSLPARILHLSCGCAATQLTPGPLA
ncbi:MULTISPECIES: hypothetical protein [Ralstonia solanacearum species complex]|uniref:Uncharacterized protein n=1 Tax=Ralstonia solanacearum K60 TaxID=1091042 RepID=A0AAP7ZJK4_RALSL|nr:hypothetical protein [Ralstonia solanacearum]OYQ10008.1 hypothetical protein B7R77_24810 [Ralstonia solanacearum K60]QOK84778.1 hypothetical protein HF906_22465 [Ralstonia solanacearum]